MGSPVVEGWDAIQESTLGDKSCILTVFQKGVPIRRLVKWNHLTLSTRFGTRSDYVFLEKIRPIKRSNASDIVATIADKWKYRYFPYRPGCEHQSSLEKKSGRRKMKIDLSQIPAMQDKVKSRWFENRAT
ncbi:10872_t:CDS:2, partial [Acaulospora colombiana]